MNSRKRVTAIAELDHRMPEAGRIRIGRRNDKARGGREALNSFRFTSVHEDLIQRIATLYGGTVTPWNEPMARAGKSQWQVTTTSTRIHVYLVPDALSQWFELWTKGGLQRRCDGYSYTRTVSRGDEIVDIVEPCVCAAQGERQCDLKTRMSVILPDVGFLGAWRFDTSSINTALELPGMWHWISQLQQGGNGLVHAVMTLEDRHDVVAKQTRNFKVVTLGVLNTPNEIAQGAASVAAIGAGVSPGAPALPAAPPVVHTVDDDVIDAEIVDSDDQLRALLVSDGAQFDLDGERFADLVIANASDPRQVHHDIVNGVVEPVRISNNKIVWRKLS